MKVNKYQKIVLLLYCTAFIYFSIIHVPFKIKRGYEIVYDTLFSNRANVDFGRLSLVIIVTTIIAVSLLFLAHNLRLTFKPRIKPTLKLKTASYIILGIIVIALAVVFLFKKYNDNLDLNKSPLSSDSTSTVIQSETTDTMKQGGLPPFVNRQEKKVKMIFPDGSIGDINEHDTLNAIVKAGAKRYIATHNSSITNNENDCSDIIALEKFKAHMNFYYPDWKIYGQPVIKQNDNCIYEIQFQTIDPHEKYINEKEIVIVRVNLRPPNFKYGTTTFETIRGELY